MSYSIVYLRKRKKLTQSQLANAIGVSKGAVGMWEIGQRTPSLSKAKEISHFFGIPVDEIEFGINND